VNEAGINQAINDYLEDDEKARTLDRQAVEDIMDSWLLDFHLT